MSVGRSAVKLGRTSFLRYPEFVDAPVEVGRGGSLEFERYLVYSEIEHHSFGFHSMSNEHLVRQILVEIDRNPSVSQRQLSTELGVSIGIVNWHMKRFVRKGLVKLHQAPVRRYLYYLTPDGFAEKARLTAEYLSPPSTSSAWDAGNTRRCSGCARSIIGETCFVGQQ